MDKVQKQQVVEELTQAFSSSAGVVLVGFSELSVAAETELRRKLMSAGGSYRVVKNRLALRASQGNAVSQLGDHFSGPTAVAMAPEDPIALAKALSDFLKGHPQISLKAGVLDQSVLSAEDVKALADMPSREELLTKVAYLLLAPVRNLAGALQAPVRSLTIILSQLEGIKKTTE
jgi:large subunit ribosomal protein L10